MDDDALDYEALAAEPDRLVEALASEMEWLPERAKRFVESDKPGYGAEGAIKTLRLRAESRKAAEEHQEAVKRLRHALA